MKPQVITCDLKQNIVTPKHRHFIISCQDINDNTIGRNAKQNEITCKLSEIYETYLNNLSKYIYFKIINAYKIKDTHNTNVANLIGAFIQIDKDYKLIFDEITNTVIKNSLPLRIDEDFIITHSITDAMAATPNKLSFNFKMKDKLKHDIECTMLLVNEVANLYFNALKESITMTSSNTLRAVNPLAFNIHDEKKVNISSECKASINKLLEIKIDSNERIDYDSYFDVRFYQSSTRTFNELDSKLLGDLDPLILDQI